MKVTLISPFPDVYSYGIRIISAVLKQAGHETQILFLTRDFWDPYSPKVIDQVIEKCKGSDLVGMTVFSNFWENCQMVTRAIRERLDIPVAWGGIHATVRPEETLTEADFAVVGEAEETVLELMEHLKKKKAGLPNGQAIPGLRERGQEEFIQRSPLADLDQIPLPDYDLETHYILNGEDLVPMTPALLGKATKGIYQTIPSRGCPYNCTFCANVYLNRVFPENMKVRHMSMRKLVAEIETIRARYPVFNHVKFDDDAFFVIDYDELAVFAEEYKKRIGLPLIVTGITANTIRRDKIELLVNAGMAEVRVGIVSATEKMRKEYARPQTERKVMEAAKLLSEFTDRCLPNYDLIIESPWETEEGLVETMRFMLDMPIPYRLWLCSLTYYPGTDVYDRAKAEGLIQDDVKDVYRKYYHKLQPTYLNSLFRALSHHTYMNEKIPKRLFLLATQPWARKTPVGWVFSWLIWTRLKTVARLKYLRMKWTGALPTRNLIPVTE
jgi:radical SAM superfamily enzyme YgiQ (UPF0313 family)